MAQRGVTQRETQLKSYSVRLSNDVKSMLENFTEIVKSAKVDEETQVARLTQAVEVQYETEVRASNIVRAGESLMKLVSDMKEFLILNDFPSVNESLVIRARALENMRQETDAVLVNCVQSLSSDLQELEEEYYSSSIK